MPLTIPYIGEGMVLPTKAKVKLCPVKPLTMVIFTFGLLWNNVEYVFFVDGTEVFRTSKGLSGIAEYMILSTELTGFGGDYTKGVYPDEVVFDYVKTYQFK